MTFEPLENYNINDFSIMSDEDIVALANSGHTLAQEFLIDKYKNFVRAKARSYFLIGADKEDIIQEGMIGLYKAIRDFRADKLSSFRPLPSYALPGRLSPPSRLLPGRSISRSIPISRSISRSMMKIPTVLCSTSSPAPVLPIQKN